MMQEPTGHKKDEKKLTFVGMLAAFFRALTNNIPLKLLCVLLSVVVWSVVITSDATLTRTKSFEDVAVTVTGSDTLRQRGLVVMEDVAALVPTVDFTAEVPQTNYDRIVGSNFGPRIDLTNVTGVGENTIPVTTMAASVYGTVTSITPESVTVTVEQYSQRSRIPVSVEITGDLLAGYWADTARADPALVTIGGPKSLIDKVARGVAQLDAGLLNGNSVTQRNAVPFTLYDRDGEVVGSSLIEVTYEGVTLDSIVAEASVYPTKDLPVDSSDVLVGELPEGYELRGITVEPETVTVAATAAVLENLSVISFDTTVSLTDQTSSFETTVRLRKGTDVRYLSQEEVTVSVEIQEKQVSASFRNVAIDIRNLDETTYTGKLSTSRANVTVTGPYFAMQSLEADQIWLYVDAQEWTEQQQELEIKVEIQELGGVKVEITPSTVRLQRTERR